MIPQQQIQLIDGKFSSHDAEEMLLKLLTNKINFYNLKSFSSQVRFGEPDETSLAQVEALRQANNELLNNIRHARQNNMRLKINAAISISLEEPSEIN